MRFTDSLDRSMEEIKRPPNLPVGHYTFTVQKHPDMDELTGRDGTVYDRLTFQMVCQAAGDDVDPTELEEFGNVQGVMIRHNFLFNTDPDEQNRFKQTEFNLKRFLGHLGVDVDNMKLNEALAESIGKSCLAEVSHRPDPNDPEVVYQEIRRTAEL